MNAIPKIRNAFSPTFLKTFNKCQRSAIFDTFSSNDKILFGNTVHDLLSKIYALDVQLDRSYFLKNIEYELQQGKLKGADFVTFWKKALSINAFLKAGAFDPPEGFSILDVESQNIPIEFREIIYGKRFFLVPLLNDNKKVRGNIDIIYYNPDSNSLLIRDWKTGTSPNDPFQVSLYMLTVIVAYGINPEVTQVTGEYVYVENNKRVVTDYCEKELLKFLEHIQHIVDTYYKAYTLRFFTTSPSFDNCRFCTVTDCGERKG